MKKVFLLLLILQSATMAAQKRKERIEFKSNVEINNTHPTKITKLNYKPIDFTYLSANRNWKINFQIQGNRSSILEPSFVTTYKKLDIENAPEVKIEETEDPFFGNITRNEVYYGENYSLQEETPTRTSSAKNTEKGLLREITKDNGHDHDHGHDHGHDHSHNHEHTHNHEHLEGEEHEAHFKREEFNLKAPKLKTPIRSKDDFQAKVDIEYFNKKNGFRYVQYLTNFKEEDGRKFKGDAIYQFKNLNVFDKKFSISVIPRLYTRNVIKPLYTDLDLDLRYQINKDTTIGAFYYSALQLEDIQNYLNTKNKVEIFYDYNTEKFRAHKFYDIIDHEHEKLDQFKIKASVEHNNVKTINHFSKNKNDAYDKDEHSYKTKLELKLKKSDVFVKGLSLSNDFNLTHNYNYETNLERFYNVKNKYKFKDSIEKSFVYDDINKEITVYGQTNIDLNKFYKTAKGYELHRLHSIKVKDPYNPDPSGNPTDRNVKFLEIIEAINKDDNTTSKEKVNHNNINIKNDSKIKYTMNKNEFSLENKFNLDKIVSNNDHSIENETILKYNRKINNNFNLELKLANKLNYYHTFNSTPYKIDLITSCFDFNHELKTNKTKFKYGLNFDYNLQLRNAKKEFLSSNYIPDILINNLPENVADEFRNQNKNEADKWVVGHEIILKPYIKFEYELIKNLKLNSELNVDSRFEKSVLKKYYGQFSPIENKMTPGKTNTIFKLGLSYVH